MWLCRTVSRKIKLSLLPFSSILHVSIVAVHKVTSTY